MKTILVAYDETEGARRALERGAELAKAFDAKLIVTSVAPLLHSSPRSSGPVDPTSSLSEHELELEHAGEFLRGKGVDAELVPAVGDPADAIVKVSEERAVDLVIVGTREPGVFERVLHQSVSQGVARHVHRDLLIVHPAH